MELPLGGDQLDALFAALDEQPPLLPPQQEELHHHHYYNAHMEFPQGNFAIDVNDPSQFLFSEQDDAFLRASQDFKAILIGRQEELATELLAAVRPRQAFAEERLPDGMRQRFKQRRGEYASTRESRDQLVKASRTHSLYWCMGDSSDALAGNEEDPLYTLASMLLGSYQTTLGKEHDSVPRKINTPEVEELTKLYQGRYKRKNGGDFLRGLYRIFFFAGATSDTLEGEFFGAQHVEEYLSVDFNVLRFCALIRVNVYAIDLNSTDAMSAVRIACRAPLLHFLQRSTEAKSHIPLLREMVQYSGSFGLKRMGLYENVEDLENDTHYVRDHDQCPLFKAYNHPRAVRAGAFGVVLIYTNVITHTDHAVKIQRITNEEKDEEKHLKDLTIASNVELAVMYIIQQLSRHWTLERREKPFNFVRLDDWVRCRLKMTEFLANVVPENSKARKHVTDKNAIHQIIVQEYVPGGTLNALLVDTPASTARATSIKCFRALAAQVFGHVHALSFVRTYSHHDLKPDNVLLENRLPSDKCRYLIYPGIDGLTDMYVDLQDCHNLVAKIADQGAASIQVGRTQLAYRTKHNPAHDVELFGLMTLWSLVRVLGTAERPEDELQSVVPVDLYAFILTCLHKGFDARESFKAESTAYEDYAIIRTLLDDLVSRKEFVWRNAQRLDAAAKAIIRVYHHHMLEWVGRPIYPHMKAFKTVLSSAFFAPLFFRPADLTEENSVVMTDYKN